MWAASSSIGQFAVQLAKLSNFTVIATASPKNHELLKSFGASHCFDYRDPDVVNKIKAVWKKIQEKQSKRKKKKNKRKKKREKNKVMS